MTPSDPAAPFRFDLRMSETLRFRRARLVSRERLTPSYVRVRLEGDELAGFDSPGADDHIRVFFPPAGAEEIDPAGLRELPSREYTPVEWTDDTLTLDFLVHGTDGIAGVWADTAPLGAPVGIGGPRGSRVLDGVPDAWFLAGDETAVPAIRRLAAAMPPDAVGRILVEVQDGDHELPVTAPAGVEVEQIHRGAAQAPAALAERIGRIPAEERPRGSVLGFIAAEQGIVRPGRALLLERWGLPADDMVVKGYWKRGTDEYHAPH